MLSKPELTETLKEIWQDILEIEDIGLKDDFYDIGGTSLLGVQINSRVMDLLEVDLLLDVLFDAPTISELAQYIIDNHENIKTDPTQKLPPLIKIEQSLIANPDVKKTNFINNGFKTKKESPKRKETEFSLFFFSADGSTSSTNKYQLVMDSARLADKLGFKAIWTPERHFAAFGGLYPNPSVLGAAIAMVTKQLQIRAGSVVLPLHQPIRIAEEWSVVDNLSVGRVGIACASGWHTNDFSLAPANFANKKQVMVNSLQTIQTLWEGNVIQQKNGSGELVDLKIFPKPIQPTLPIWLACHSEETFVLAGQLGVNVVTNLFGEQLKNIAHKIRIYRQALTDNGFDADSKKVSLMVHTFLGEDLIEVQTTFKQAYRNYLEVNLDLQHKQVKGKGQNLDIKPIDKENIIKNATNRLLNQHGLIGTPESCLPKINFFESIGIDEIACLIDFGIPQELVLKSLYHIKEMAKMKASSSVL